MRVADLCNWCGVLSASLPVSLALGQNITILTNTVGDVGNVADSTGYGAVNYQYSIGRYEVTNAQYVSFLNAKAVDDPHGLYNPYMSSTPHGGITRAGASGAFTYSTIAGREDWAVNYVSFWDAARFVNWMQNGQGDGDTESGTYSLSASGMYANSIVRNAGSTWAVASRDEWYKAAYYRGGGLNSGYWVYGTASDAVTTAMANYGDSSGVLAVGVYPFASAYGAFDMAGNVFEWNDSIVTRVVNGDGRGVRGGSFNHSDSDMSRFYSIASFPTNESAATGFRVSMIPGPSSMVVLCAAFLGARGRKRVVELSYPVAKRLAA